MEALFAMIRRDNVVPRANCLSFSSAIKRRVLMKLGMLATAEEIEQEMSDSLYDVFAALELNAPVCTTLEAMSTDP